MVTGPEVESGTLEEGKEEEGRERVYDNESEIGERGENQPSCHVCHSEQTSDYTHVDTFNVDHTHLSDVVDLVGLSLSVSYHVTVHSTLDHGQG